MKWDCLCIDWVYVLIEVARNSRNIMQTQLCVQFWRLRERENIYLYSSRNFQITYTDIHSVFLMSGNDILFRYRKTRKFIGISNPQVSNLILFCFICWQSIYLFISTDWLRKSVCMLWYEVKSLGLNLWQFTLVLKNLKPIVCMNL